MREGDVTGCGTDGRRESVGEGEGRRRGKFGIAFFWATKLGLVDASTHRALVDFTSPLNSSRGPSTVF
jgi:hypothetical protein